jgi:putative transcriptional regulator
VRTIRELREERRWTQLQLANLLKVTPVTVYNWERGKYEPSASMFRQIARVFGMSMDEIRLVGEELPEETLATPDPLSPGITNTSERRGAALINGKLRTANGR